MIHRRAFTLMEVLLVMALVSVMLGLLLLVVSRLARMTRTTVEASLRRRHWMQASEQLRWQLRNVLLPAVSKAAAQEGIRPGLLGGPDIPLWGEPGQEEGRDSILFVSTYALKRRAVCEVGYRLLPRAGGNFDLAYREFPLRDRGGLHLPAESPDAPWKVILDDVTHLSVDYSEDGWQWRRDWSLPQVPRRIRIHLEANKLPTLDFQVTPGLGGGRW